MGSLLTKLNAEKNLMIRGKKARANKGEGARIGGLAGGKIVFDRSL